jgi:phenylacetic acid degradation operon negative regulatory protein
MLDAVQPAIPDPVAALLRQFRRQRPIRGGSLLITIFGDSIAPRGGAATLGSLAGDSWLVARRDGRRSEYRITPTGRDRFAAATRRIYGTIPDSWGGQWTLVILPPANGGRRQDVRDELRWLGFGQVSPGVFAHPNWSVEEAREGLKGVEGAAEGLLLKSSSEGSDTDRQLVAAGWDLGDLTRRYRKFLGTFTPVADALGSTATDEAAFIVRTLLIHEYRKIHLQDPLLPPALLPVNWVGAAAYDLSKHLYSTVFPAAERYLSNTASTTAGPLPTADSSAFARFGGLDPGV